MTNRVYIHGCANHPSGHGGRTELRSGGIGGSEEEQEQIMEILMCGGCWGRDPRGCERAMRAMGFSEQDIVIVKSHAMQGKSSA